MNSKTTTRLINNVTEQDNR